MKFSNVLSAAILTLLLFSESCTKQDSLQQYRPSAQDGLQQLSAQQQGTRFIKDAYIIILKDEVSNVSQVVNEMIDGLIEGPYTLTSNKAKYIYEHAIKGFAMELPKAAIDKISQDIRVKYIEQDQEISVNLVQSKVTWGIDRTDQLSLPLDSNYNYQNTGSTVDAYIFDTGIRQDHAEFGGRAKPGYDAIITGGKANDGNGHGTHVAGTVGGTNYGMAKKVNLIAVKVLADNGSGSLSGVIAGIDWAVGNHTTRPAVGNLSLGGGASTSIDDAVKRAVADGIVMCVAAGNDYQDASLYSPARTAEAITVGATTSLDRFASYSNYGAVVDILAPGSSITSAWPSSTTATNTISGTSMATPHVAGAAALYLESFPGSTTLQVANGLKTNASANKITSVPVGTVNLLLYTRYSNTKIPIPIAPILNLPANAATNISTSPTLSWQTTSGATSYQVQVSTSSSFSTTVFNVSVTGTAITFSNLKNSTTYYWRVNATNSSGTSTWSATRSFTTIAPIILAIPTLSSPKNAAINVPTSATLAWNIVNGAAAYDLQLGTNSSMTILAIDKTGLAGTSVNVVGMKKDTEYFWRIRSRNGTTVSAWSTIWSFRTIK